MLTLYLRIQKIIIVFTILILTIGSINCGKNQQGIQHISNVLDNLHKYIKKQVTFNGVVTSVTNAADQQTVGFYYIIDISNKSIKVMANKLPTLNEKVTVTGIVQIDTKLEIPYLRETSKLIVGGGVSNSDSSNTANYKNDTLPKYKGYINDYANVLSSDDSEMIHMMLSELDKEMGIQAVVVTINSINDYNTRYTTIEEFATGLLNQWKIGGEKNNGVVILLSLKEQKCRIILGTGYQEAYNSVMEQIIDEKMIPTFVKNSYSEGMFDGVSEIIMEITKIDFGKIKVDNMADDTKPDVTIEEVNADQYRFGIGVTGNQHNAFELYKKAADQGDTDAMVELSEYYEQGIWVKRDHEKAIALLKKAADAGSVSAKWQLEFLKAEE